MTFGCDEIERLISVARDRSPGVLVVAEKVESHDDIDVTLIEAVVANHPSSTFRLLTAVA